MDNQTDNIELNFLLEFNLSKNGMIQEIIKEFDILRICFTQLVELDKQYHETIEKIMVMPLRKLLCENKSVLLQVCPDFKMPVLDGRWLNLDKLKMIRPPLAFSETSTWIPLSTWLETKIAYYDKGVTDIPKCITQSNFQCILNKLRKPERVIFENFYELKEVLINKSKDTCYVLKSSLNITDNQTIYDTLKKIYYYDLTIYNFIKHISDKRGAHIDIGHSPLVNTVNQKDDNDLNLMICFSVQLIWSAKNQVPELSDYWPEFDNIINEIINDTATD